MEKFEITHKEITERAKAKNACSDQYKRALEAKTLSELLKVVADNISWCHENEVVNYYYLVERFEQNDLIESGLYNSGKDNVGYSNTGDRNTGDWNTGDSNTGYWNTGHSNTGHSNTGYSNTGYSNTGHSNTGYSNTGHSNTGYRNTGDSNTGDRNTGDWNTGDRNTGDRNTGDWNTGDSNTGYSNTGDRNTGVFCTGEPDKIKMFNKQSDWTEEDFKSSKAWRLLCDVDTKLWIPDHKMTDIEKENNRGWKNAGGFYRDIPFKQAFSDRWNNWSEENKQAFKSLPNFDADIFEQITSVKI
jgi:hypothetical protein